jgi:hypothetical protein
MLQLKAEYHLKNEVYGIDEKFEVDRRYVAPMVQDEEFLSFCNESMLGSVNQEITKRLYDLFWVRDWETEYEAMRKICLVDSIKEIKITKN